MPPKRQGKRGGARKGAGRKRMAGKKVSLRIRQPLAVKPHAFCERLTSQYLTVEPAVSATGIMRNFVFDDIVQKDHYKALFEYYTINKIVCTFRYKAQGNSAAGSATGNQQWNEICPIIYFKVDHNDNDPTTLADLKLSMKTREVQLSSNKPNFSISLKPAIQAEAYRTALTSGYSPKWGAKISTDDGLVPHYGLKAYAVGPNTTVGTTFGQVEMEYKMYFTMKNNE